MTKKEYLKWQKTLNIRRAIARFCEKHLKDFLPDRMFDAHVHISTSGLKSYGSHNGGSTRIDYLCKDMGVGEFLAMNKEMSPNQKVEALIFGMCLTDSDETNAYVIENNKDYHDRSA